MSTLLALIVMTGLDRRLTLWHAHSGAFMLVGALVVVVLTGIIWSLFYTRSIAGPLRRIIRILDAIAAGEGLENPPIRFRRGDRFQQIAGSLDGCIARFGRQEHEIQRLHEGIDVVLSLLEKKNEADSKEARRLLERLRSGGPDA